MYNEYKSKFEAANDDLFAFFCYRNTFCFLRQYKCQRNLKLEVFVPKLVEQ